MFDRRFESFQSVACSRSTSISGDAAQKRMLNAASYKSRSSLPFHWFPPPKKHWNWEKEIWYDSVWGEVCQTHDASQIIGSVLGRVPKALIHLNLPLLMGAECTRDAGFLQSFLAEIWKSDLLQELFVFLCVKTGNEETKQSVSRWMRLKFQATRPIWVNGKKSNRHVSLRIPGDFLKVGWLTEFQ